MSDDSDDSDDKDWAAPDPQLPSVPPPPEAPVTPPPTPPANPPPTAPSGQPPGAYPGTPPGAYPGIPPGTYPGGPAASGIPGQALKPGIVPLRPLGLGEILDGAISYIRAHPRLTLGLSAVIITVSQVLQVPTQWLMFRGLEGLGDQPTAGEVAGAVTGGGATVIGLVVLFLAVTVLTGLLIVVVSRAVLGQPVHGSEVWAAAKPRMPGLLGLSALIALAGITVLAVAATPITIAAVAGAPAALIGFLAMALGAGAIVALIYIWVVTSLATPAYMLEGGNVPTALRRSWHLARPQFWRIFGILLLANIIAQFIGGIIGVPFSLAGAVIGGDTSGSLFAGTGLVPMAIGGVGGIIANTIIAPFLAGVTGLLYVDQRIRREALDLQLARAVTWGAEQ